MSSRVAASGSDQNQMFIGRPWRSRARAGPRRVALRCGDQQRRAADGDGVEDVVARRAGQAFDGAGEAVPGQQAAAFGVAVRLALLAQHRLAAVHAREGELGMGLVDDALQSAAATRSSSSTSRILGNR